MMDLTTLFDVRDRTALVTGASLGIGAMIAEGLVRAGAKVWICSRKEADIQATRDRLSAWGECHAITADLSRDEGLVAVGAAMGEAIDTLDILVNNAGASWAAPISDFPRLGFEKVLNINLVAPFMLVQRLLPLLRKAARPDHPARVINIASIDGMRPPALDSFAYSASKAGMIMLTKHMARALAADSITVNAIAPGIFASRMTSFWFDEAHPHHVPPPTIALGDRPGADEDIVAAVLYLAARSGSYLTGVTLPVAGGEATVN
ncbi:SDR family NAD(P)-dependent oxidoreductase [Sphingobium sp. 3R8]|uniref:SDR family NAD(P)-dependent oxidoreductase n=1 Tax=Sphingobium sp. 3R8 TaxID=2874921 RepID=UPI001CCCDD5B|nr:SDR family NAD(P)-dependent oxidoreductase [Sphingobium sp. 3R8]MBZ9646883.1 SDR family NAD(P)-dependent oxidoreductase [Sphingobium sp. 3R8]